MTALATVQPGGRLTINGQECQYAGMGSSAAQLRKERRARRARWAAAQLSFDFGPGPQRARRRTEPLRRVERPALPPAVERPPNTIQDEASLLAWDLRQLIRVGAPQLKRNGAFAQLWKALEPMVSRILRSVPHRGTVQAADISQCVAMSVLKSVDKWDPAFSFAGWAFRDARPAVLELLRQQAHDVHASHWAAKGRGGAPRPEIEVQGLDGVSPADEPESSPDEEIDRANQAQWVRRALGVLPDQHQAIVRAVLLNGESVRQFAERTGWSRTRADKTLKDAKLLLLALLKPKEEP